MNDKNRKPTQAQRILAYLKNHRYITQREAINDIGCYRLGARIWELKHDGHPIKTEIIPVKNRWGEVSHVAAYSLED